MMIAMNRPGLEKCTNDGGEFFQTFTPSTLCNVFSRLDSYPVFHFFSYWSHVFFSFFNSKLVLLWSKNMSYCSPGTMKQASLNHKLVIDDSKHGCNYCKMLDKVCLLVLKINITLFFLVSCIKLGNLITPQEKKNS